MALSHKIIKKLQVKWWKIPKVKTHTERLTREEKKNNKGRA
jgi:hypothetical protein